MLSGPVARNMLALLTMQGGTYVLPLILIPFLIRSLGIETFGDWVFASSFVAIFRTIVAYGFDMTATREVAICRDDTEQLGRLYVAIVSARFILLSLCIFAVVICWLFIVDADQFFSMVILYMLVIAGEAIFPVWLYQGMEHMSMITRLRLGYKFLHVLAVVLLVRGPGDVMLIPLLDAIGSIAVGIMAMRYAYSLYGLRSYFPDRKLVILQLREGWSVFLSNVAVHLYTTANTILLGFLLGPIAVAKYAIAEKAYYAARGLLGTAVQALFPLLSRTFAIGLPEFRSMARRATVAYFGGLVIAAGLLMLSAGLVVSLISGTHDREATLALQILSAALCLAMGGLFSSLLVIQRRGTSLVVVTSLTTALNIILAPATIWHFGVVGAAAVLLITQLFHVGMQIVANWAVLFSPKA
jgi:PST family polysaccharide transporter